MKLNSAETFVIGVGATGAIITGGLAIHYDEVLHEAAGIEQTYSALGHNKEAAKLEKVIDGNEIARNVNAAASTIILGGLGFLVATGEFSGRAKREEETA